VKMAVQRAEADAESREHHFNLDLEPELPMIFSDAKRISQALSHVLNNAIKYTPDKGTITVSVTLENKDEKESAFIEIAVQDTGIGIAPEDREQVFDKFYRAGDADLHSTGHIKFKGAGPGLGLSIAKGIIERLNGRIWLESQGYDEVNCPGCLFHIQLPVT
ncbi:MAG: ATP-binding protein, partial [Chloroflexota bacterium]